jgi:prolyl-tRNA editing enzyme YbaK/EbsC (Cys-tRNA(Pro) deacylase)
MTAATDIETRVRAALAASGLPYDLIDIDPTYADTAAFCARYGVELERSGNCILVASKKPPGKYAACVLLATTRLDVNHAVRHRMGAGRVSFAAPEETRVLTGMEIGGVTPLALPTELPIYVDARVMTLPRIVLGGGSRSLKIDVPPAIFERLPNPVEVVDGLATHR